MSDHRTMAEQLVEDGEMVVASEGLAQECVNALEPKGYVVRYGYAAETEGAWKVVVICRPDEPWIRACPDGTPEKPWSGDWVKDDPRRLLHDPEGGETDR